MERLFTRQEIAEYLRVSVRTVDRLLISQDIPIIQIRNRLIRIPESSVNLILQTKTLSGGERKDLFEKIYKR